jgi:hypothetical protein
MVNACRFRSVAFVHPETLHQELGGVAENLSMGYPRADIAETEGTCSAGTPPLFVSASPDRSYFIGLSVLPGWCSTRFTRFAYRAHRTDLPSPRVLTGGVK